MELLYTGKESCFNSVSVQQIGFFSIPSERQSIIPWSNFTCNGRITGIIVSTEKNNGGLNDPYLEIWHPQTSDYTIFDKVGEVQLTDIDAVAEVDSNNNNFWLLKISLNESDKIEFESGDLIGFYHPPAARYQVWMIDATGYTIHGNFSTNPSSTFSIDNSQISAPDRQPIIEFIIGMNNCIELSVKYFHICRHPM